MSALLDSLAAAFDASGDGDAERRAVLDALLRDGLPGPRSEAWRYTPLRALERRRFAPAGAAAVDPARLAAIPAPRLVFVNGQFDAALSDLSGLPAGVECVPVSHALRHARPRDTDFLLRRFDRADEPFARLNAALAREGMRLRVDDGVQVDAPLHLVQVGAALAHDAAWHLRHFIELRRGARLTLVEHQLADGAHAHLANLLAHVHLAAGARLLHLRSQDEAPAATLFLRTDAVLAREARYRRLDLELGGGLARHELNVRLEGQHAALQADGVLLAHGRRHVETRLGIDHIARDTQADLGWRGIAAGQARAVFHGGILIRAGADGTRAALANKNLLLSAQAEIDTQPVLEIHADEVQAAHGATVGQLDPTALFYLRARGIDQAQARRLLTAAFCRELLAGLEPPAQRTRLEDLLDAALARLSA